MGGMLSIVDGKVYIDDIEIDGGVGEIEIMGFIDFNIGGLNYNVLFVLNVIGNLLFLVYFLVMLFIVFVVFVIDQVLIFVKVILNVNYCVIGIIKDFKFDEVECNSKDISLFV